MRELVASLPGGALADLPTEQLARMLMALLPVEQLAEALRDALRMDGPGES